MEMLLDVLYQLWIDAITLLILEVVFERVRRLWSRYVVRKQLRLSRPSHRHTQPRGRSRLFNKITTSRRPKR